MVWFREPTLLFKYIWARYLFLRTGANLVLGFFCITGIASTDLLMFKLLWLCPLIVIILYLMYSWNIYFEMKKIALASITKEDPIRSLYDFVAGFEYMPMKDKRGKLVIKTYIDCFNEKQGVCWEQSAVLNMLYKFIGLKSKIIWVSVNSDGDKVDHICLKVKINNSWEFIDPTVCWGATHLEVNDFWILNLPLA